MKHLVVLTILIPLLFASCSNSKKKKEHEDVMKAFRENNYNFTDYKKVGYKGINFKLPEAFETDYGGGYTYKRNAFLRRDFHHGILFTVEKFTESDLNSELMEDIMIEDNLLNGFHDAYAARRYESLSTASISYKKATKKNIPYKGITQVISGSSSDYSDINYYAMATIKIKDDYYIFQMISEQNMMNYVFDDFERILASIRRKK